MEREERKREQSPASFFFSQGQALVLAAEYFKDDRLNRDARGGVADKHRHRIHLALFGQLMASLEFLFKDFIARVVDLVPTFDDHLLKADWIKVDAARILSMRSAVTTAGSLLLHPTLGWQQPEEVNRRYKALFGVEPITAAEVHTLETLWILRHSVAHNAGFVSAYDAARAGVTELADKVADIDQKYVSDSFDFLCKIAQRVADNVGHQVVMRWLATRKALGPDYIRDKDTYCALKLLATYVASRAKDLPTITKGPYTSDFNKVRPA
jgi:hypothetical protein